MLLVRRLFSPVKVSYQAEMFSTERQLIPIKLDDLIADYLMLQGS